MWIVFQEFPSTKTTYLRIYLLIMKSMKYAHQLFLKYPFHVLNSITSYKTENHNQDLIWLFLLQNLILPCPNLYFSDSFHALTRSESYPPSCKVPIISSFFLFSIVILFSIFSRMKRAWFLNFKASASRIPTRYSFRRSYENKLSKKQIKIHKIISKFVHINHIF